MGNRKYLSYDDEALAAALAAGTESVKATAKRFGLSPRHAAALAAGTYRPKVRRRIEQLRRRRRQLQREAMRERIRLHYSAALYGPAGPGSRNPPAPDRRALHSLLRNLLHIS